MPVLVNGLMEYAIMQDGGRDQFNNPLPAIITWSKPIPCHIMTVTHRNDGVAEDGVFTNSSYKIWIEAYGREMSFYPERVRLTQDGVNVGEWQVQAPPQWKHSNGRIEFIVGNRLNRQV